MEIKGFNMELSHNARFVRIGSLSDSFRPPANIAVNTVKELSTYCAEILAQPGTDPALSDVVGQYDDAFFAEHTLVLAFLEEPSGSIRHNLERMSLKDGTITLSIRRILGGIGTADMAQWLVLAAIGKTHARRVEVHDL